MRFLLLALALPGCLHRENNPTRCPETTARYRYGEPGLRVLPGERWGTDPGSKPAGRTHGVQTTGGEVIDEWTLYRRDRPQPTR